MSIRAYPIIKIEYSAPLFNLWHDEEIADELMRQGYLKGADENGGYIDAPVSLIQALSQSIARITCLISTNSSKSKSLARMIGWNLYVFKQKDDFIHPERRRKMRTINYVKKWDENGTCYRQGIHITSREYNALYDRLQAERHNPTIKDHYQRMYLFQPLKKQGNIIFTNLTQRDYFAKPLHLSKEKRYRDVNTYFIVD